MSASQPLVVMRLLRCWTVDIAIVDFMMPKMTCTTLFKRIQERHRWRPKTLKELRRRGASIRGLLEQQHLKGVWCDLKSSRIYNGYLI